jgi:hypothetical protein
MEFFVLYRMTFRNRLALNGGSVDFIHTLRVPVRVTIVETYADDAGPTCNWTIEIESQSKQIANLFAKQIVEQLLAYLKARTKKPPHQIRFDVIISLAQAKDFAGVNLDNE